MIKGRIGFIIGGPPRIFSAGHVTAMLKVLVLEVETEGKRGPSSGSMVKVWFWQIGDVKRS